MNSGERKEQRSSHTDLLRRHVITTIGKGAIVALLCGGLRSVQRQEVYGKHSPSRSRFLTNLCLDMTEIQRFTIVLRMVINGILGVVYSNMWLRGGTRAQLAWTSSHRVTPPDLNMFSLLRHPRGLTRVCLFFFHYTTVLTSPTGFFDNPLPLLGCLQGHPCRSSG